MEHRRSGGGNDPPLGTWQQPCVKQDSEKERDIVKPNSYAFIQYLQMWKSTEKRPVCGRTDNQVYKELCEICSCGESSLRPRSKKLPSHSNTVIVIYLVFIGVSVILFQCIPAELIILLCVQVKLLFLASVPAENEGFAAVWSTSVESCRRTL